ncbi:double homeobox protein 4-like protein 4 [Leguminivora glycinivorella]|uniref:double homeobox protein 4-like protein 4 n=1 Tax=Leguminivora glycinivorella TaxID=1035111 RepID=UPI00200BAFD0|nr:double homeobox protein 4-like protein 4 [Leguminivora glycinivorella]
MPPTPTRSDPAVRKSTRPRLAAPRRRNEDIAAVKRAFDILRTAGQETLRAQTPTHEGAGEARYAAPESVALRAMEQLHLPPPSSRDTPAEPRPGPSRPTAADSFAADVAVTRNTTPPTTPDEPLSTPPGAPKPQRQPKTPRKPEATSKVAAAAAARAARATAPTPPSGAAVSAPATRTSAPRATKPAPTYSAALSAPRTAKPAPRAAASAPAPRAAAPAPAYRAAASAPAPASTPRASPTAPAPPPNPAQPEIRVPSPSRFPPPTNLNPPFSAAPRAAKKRQGGATPPPHSMPKLDLSPMDTTSAASPPQAAPTRPTTPTSSKDEAASLPATKSGKRYPPLIVEEMPDWPMHFRELRTLLGHHVNARPLSKGIIFTPHDEEEYRIVQSYLGEQNRTNGIHWYCYGLPAERSLKVAIRGLPANTAPADIEEDLRKRGFLPDFVRQISARSGRPGCIFHAQLQRTAETTPAIYAISELLGMPGVIIEAWRGRKGPAQCHRCQGFRHSSVNCHRPQACVRCAEPHPASQCKRDRKEPATCKNCQGPHPANSTECPVYIREARNKKAGVAARTGAPPPPPTQPTADANNAPQSLMAAANDGKRLPARRRKRGGKRKTKTGPNPTPAPQQKPEQPSTAPIAAAPQSQPPTDPPPTVAPPPQGKKAKSGGGAADSRTETITIIEGILLDLLAAVQSGQSPVPTIVRKLAEL